MKQSIGIVEYLSKRPHRGAEIESCTEIKLNKEKGIHGDYYSKKGRRQVTLIQAEHLDLVSRWLNKTVRPEFTRRNILVKGINLQALKNKKFQIGEVILEGTGDCYPCEKMNHHIGPGGLEALEGHGGITAQVVKDGCIQVGDPVQALNPE